MSGVVTPVGNSYLDGDNRLRSWFFSLDHKRIGILYLISITLFFFIGSLAALVFRVELMAPKGMFLESDGYNRLFSLHGIVMVFLFLIPAIPATLGNFLLPIMVGAKDLAFPKLNLASWYVFMLSGAFILWSIIGGGVDTGWTFYTPYSTTYANTQVMAAALGAFIAGFSSIFTAINFVVTIHTMRAPGLTWFRLPLFVWALYGTSLVIILRHTGACDHVSSRRGGASRRRGDFRSLIRRGSYLVPTSVLVLFPSRRVHYDFTRDGVLSAKSLRRSHDDAFLDIHLSSMRRSRSQVSVFSCGDTTCL